MIEPKKSDRLVYDAEASVPPGVRYESLEDVRNYVRMVCASSFWREHATARPTVAVLSTRSTKYATSSGSFAAIYLPKWGWTQKTILHELAHQLTDSRHGAWHLHDGHYRYWYARLVGEFLGPMALHALVENYLERDMNPWEMQAPCLIENRAKAKPVLPERGPVYLSDSDVSYATHLRLAEVSRRLDQAGKSTSSFVRAFGGDKGEREPIAEHWRVTYARGQRWLPRECLEHFDDIADKKPRVNEAARWLRRQQSPGRGRW